MNRVGSQATEPMNVELRECKHRRNSSEQRKEKENKKDLKGNFHSVLGFPKPEFYGLAIILKFHEPKHVELHLLKNPFLLLMKTYFGMKVAKKIEPSLEQFGLQFSWNSEDHLS